ncbi:MAG: 2TM domain-containing protein [Ferruginibacter sp.]|nr:2TM domain-containing protein [Chitinophagaceae bacterium]
MEKYSQTPDIKDEKLWAIAKKRAGFKKDVVIYLLVNALLWMIWLLSAGYNNYSGVPWPVWPTAGWGIAILIQYLEAYQFPKENRTEKEYEKLKQQYK